MSVPPASSGSGADARPSAAQSKAKPTPAATPATARPTTARLPAAQGDMPLGVAISTGTGESGTVTARKAGGLRDMALEVNPHKVGVKAALQHLAKAVNIAFQTDFGENYLESVYQAAIVQARPGPHHSQGVFRLRRQLVRPVRPPDPLAAVDPRRTRPRVARRASSGSSKGAGHDPRHPQLDRPQARPGRRIRGSRAGLRRTDVRPARSVGHHPRLGPQRLGDLDDQIGLDIRIAPRPEAKEPEAVDGR